MDSAMQIIDSASRLNSLVNEKLTQGMRVGLVPTMGALHEGHLSLIEKAKKENDLVVCSIFVNPIQFNDKKDLRNYPRPIAMDIKLLENCNTDILFLPSVDEIYPIINNKSEAIFGDYDTYNAENSKLFPESKKNTLTQDHCKIVEADSLDAIVSKIDLMGLDKRMEGEFRPGHFLGVLKVVYRLFEITTPTHAYFGEKDFQQLAIIQRMVKVLSMPVSVRPCAIKREKNGLAMSSRNTLLTTADRLQAGFIFDKLQWAKKLYKQGEKLQTIRELIRAQFDENEHFQLEYFEMCDAESLTPLLQRKEAGNTVACIAVVLDKVRLIDNIMF